MRRQTGITAAEQLETNATGGSGSTVDQGTGGSSAWLVKSNKFFLGADYVSNAPTSTTDVFTFKTGGSGGTTVGTVTVVYTDSTKTVLSTATLT